MEEDDVEYGILLCYCNAYPVVAGIPYMRTNKRAERAMETLGNGRPEQAAAILLERDEPVALDLGRERSTTFREALEQFAPDTEGTYLLYRFSDPGYVSSEALVHGLGDETPGLLEHVLDVGGGTGQLGWSLERRGETGLFVIADISFWKLLLAKAFVSRQSVGVCCDANVPLPFKREAFSLVHSSDAFHYVWNRRLLAGEMKRAARSDGTILLTHLHNADTWNESAGMPLPPSGYRQLFPGICRVHPERAVVDAYLKKETIDLDVLLQDDELAGTNALVLIATDVRPPAVMPSRWKPHEGFRVNPLYEPDGAHPDEPVYVLRLPSEMYERETELAANYLPETFTLGRTELPDSGEDHLTPRVRELADRLALLPLPENYL